MKKYFLITLLLFLCRLNTVTAEQLDFKKYFEVDLDSPVPNLKILEKELTALTEVYNPRYVVSWDMGLVFDKVWRGIITSYGTTEKRLKTSGEDDLAELIATLPKKYYPYIGPMLHASPGISEKILNMPGIKETKNKFPERIAPQLQGIEDLEFISPHLYLLLMPEAWPENRQPIETPKLRPAQIPQVPYEPTFYANVLKSVPDGGFGGANARGDRPLQDNLRTLQITKTSPLTTADIKSFTKTLSGVLAFSTLENNIKIIHAGSLLDYYEAKNGTALEMNNLKDLVNPCQRLALKLKWAGLETEFSKIIAKEGFNLKEWAYTCDKTIKAYRIAIMTGPKLVALKQYKKSVYDSYLKKLSSKWQDRQYANMEAFLEMYKTNRNDVMEALKNEELIQEQIRPFGSLMLLSPLSF